MSRRKKTKIGPLGPSAVVPTSARVVGLVLLAVLAWTAISFLPSLKGDFTNWDDDFYVKFNPIVRNFSWQNAKVIFLSPFCSLNQLTPLIVFTFSLENRLFGLNPFYFHLDNLLLHLLNTFLVFVLGYRLSDKRWLVASLTAILFGIHPMHVESVAWIVERKDVLYAVFFLTSLLCYLSYKAGGKRVLVLLSLLCFVLSVMAKPMALMLPLLLILIDRLKGYRLDRRSVLEKIPFFAVALYYGLPAVVAQALFLLKERPDFLAKTCFWQLAFYAPFFYVFHLIWPLDLSCFYPSPLKSNGSWPWSVTLSPFLVLVVFVCLIRAYRHDRKGFFGVAFYGLSLIPALEMIAVNNSFAYDRNVYLPSLGLFYWIAECCQGFCDSGWLTRRRINAPLFWSAVGVILIGFSVLTWQRCKVWRSSQTLWKDVIRHDPNNVTAYNCLGAYYLTQGQVTSALESFDQVLKIDPKNVKSLSNRGVCFIQMGQFEMACNVYNKLIEMKPDFREAYLNRALAFRQTGRTKEALHDYDQAICFKPADPMAFFERAMCYTMMKDYYRAMNDYGEVIRLDPTYWQAYKNRALIYTLQGNTQKAIEEYGTVLKYNPEDLDTYNNRGLNYANSGDYERAIQDFSRALAVDQNYFPAKKNLERAMSQARQSAEYSALTKNNSKDGR